LSSARRQRYRSDTLIAERASDSGAVRIVDFMPWANAATSRIVEARGAVPIEMLLDTF
jgi:hypothetical protein